MNLSTPNLSLNSSRPSTLSTASKGAGLPTAAEKSGGFEEVFAGLAQAGDSAGTMPEEAPRAGETRGASEDTPCDAGEVSAAVDAEIKSKKKEQGGVTLVPDAIALFFQPPPQMLRVESDAGSVESQGLPELSDGNAAPGAAPELTRDGSEGLNSPADALVANATPPAPLSTLPARVAAASQPGKSPTVAGSPWVDEEHAPVARENAVPATELEPRSAAASPHGDALSKPKAVGLEEANLAENLAAATSVKPERPPLKTTRPLLAADFAETPAGGLEVRARGKSGGLKNFLSNNDKVLANAIGDLGTNVAKPPTEMPSLPSTVMIESVFAKNTLSPRVEAALADFTAQQSTEAGGAPRFSHAQRAIEAVFEAGERFTTEAQRAVKMDFSVSGEDLSVRVELQAGEVRTTFHTTSAELRSVLAHEWQVLAAGDPARSHRFADPIFSNDSAPTAGHGHGGDNQGNHRGHEMNQPRERLEFSPRPPAAGAARGADLPANSSIAVPLTALRLHTFA